MGNCPSDKIIFSQSKAALINEFQKNISTFDCALTDEGGKKHFLGQVSPRNESMYTGRCAKTAIFFVDPSLNRKIGFFIKDIKRPHLRRNRDMKIVLHAGKNSSDLKLYCKDIKTYLNPIRYRGDKVLSTTE